MADFKIVITGPGKGKVYRNGELLDGVIGVKVCARLDEPTIVEVEMLASEVEVEAAAESGPDE